MHTPTIGVILLLGSALSDAPGSLVAYRIEGRVDSIEYLTDGQFSDIGLGGLVAIDLVFDDDNAPITSEDTTSTWIYQTGLSGFEIASHHYTPEDLEGWNSFSFTNNPVGEGASDVLIINGQLTEKDVPGNFFVQIDLDPGFVPANGPATLPPLTAPAITPLSSTGYFNIGNPNTGVALGWSVTSITRVPTPSGLLIAISGFGLAARRRR